MKPVGKRVVVINRDTGRPIFTGHRADIGPPWFGWSRIIPDQEFIDLPPMYEVVEVKEAQQRCPRYPDCGCREECGEG